MFNQIILIICFSISAYASNDAQTKDLSKVRKEKIRQVFRNNLKTINKCYDDTKKQFPEKDLNGKIVLEVNFDEKGQVIYGGISNTKSEIDDENLSECFQKEMLKWKFPKSEKKEMSQVYFPVVFESNK